MPAECNRARKTLRPGSPFNPQLPLRILLAPLLPRSLGGRSCTLISRITGPESSSSIGGVLSTSSTFGIPNTNLGAVLPDSAAAAEEDEDSFLVPVCASSATPRPAVVAMAAAAVGAVWGGELLAAVVAEEEGWPRTTREVLSSACCRGLAAEVLAVAVARREAVVASRQSISLSLSSALRGVLSAEPAREIMYTRRPSRS